MPRFGVPSSGVDKKSRQRPRHVSFGVTQTWTFGRDSVASEGVGAFRSADALLAESSLGEISPLQRTLWMSFCQYQWKVSSFLLHLVEAWCGARNELVMESMQVRAPSPKVPYVLLGAFDLFGAFSRHLQVLNDVYSREIGLRCELWCDHSGVVARKAQRHLLGAAAADRAKVVAVEADLSQVVDELKVATAARCALEESLVSMSSRLERSLREVAEERASAVAARAELQLYSSQVDLLEREVRGLSQQNSLLQSVCNGESTRILTRMRLVQEAMAQTFARKSALATEYLRHAPHPSHSMCDVSVQTVNRAPHLSLSHFAKLCQEEFATARSRGAVVGKTLAPDVQLQLCARLGLPTPIAQPLLRLYGGAVDDVDEVVQHSDSEVVVHRTSSGSFQFPAKRSRPSLQSRQAQRRRVSPGSEERDRELLLQSVLASSS